MKRLPRFLLALSAALLTPAMAVNFTGLYSQNFDSMGTAGVAPPTDWSVIGAFGGSDTTWASSIPASGIVGGTAISAVTAATAYTATSDTNGFNYATTTATGDRALGTSPTSGAGVAIQFTLTNTSGAAISALQVRYDTRRFIASAGANELPGYWLFYSLDHGTSWTNVSATNPTITTVPNSIGVTTQASATITLSSALANNDTLLFRWVDDNSITYSPDQVIGLDNVSITTVPADASKTALFLNGASQYATMGGSAVALGAANFTVETWFKRTGAGVGGTTGTGGLPAGAAIPMVTKGRDESDGSAVDCNYWLGLSYNSTSGTFVIAGDFEAYDANTTPATPPSGYPALALTGGTAPTGQNYPVFGTTGIVVDTWYHAAVTYDGFNMRIYLNGVLEATRAVTTGASQIRPRFDSTQHFGIGTAMNSSGTAVGFFQGVIDESRVWNVARTVTEIAATKDAEIPIATTGLLARYGLNENTGTFANNSVGVAGAPVGVIVASPVWVSGAPFVANVLPTVTLTEPDPGEVFDAPASVYMTANAADSDGTVAKVEYYANGSKIGEATAAPYEFFWNNVFTGNFTLTAKTIDNGGAFSISDPLSISVTNTDNVAPAAVITAPATGVSYAGNITITASASDTDGTVSKVEFYNGSTKLGEDTTAPYSFTWNSVAVGIYTLSVIATDNDGGITTSGTVNINVQSAPISFSQNFDSMGTTGTAAPSGWSFYGYTVGSNTTWASTIPATSVSGGTANATLIQATTFNTTSTKSATQGYNFALSTVTSDRALGTSPATTQGVALQWSVTNTGSTAITAIRLGYETRRFTLASTANELPGYWVYYSLDNGTTWTNAPALNPTLAGPSGIIVPNSVGVTTAPPTDIALTGPWSVGATLLLRWVDDNALETSADQIIGLDNVLLTAAAAQIGASPTVAITAPATTDSFIAPASVNITANAADSDGTISKVEFYNGVTKLGESSVSPYSYAWSGVAAGTYNLTARATDNDGNIITSAAVSITINPAPGSGTLTRAAYLQKASPTSMTIRWRSSQSIAGRVKYGAAAASLTSTVNESSATTDHEITLTGLTANTIYFYSIGSAYDTLAGGNSAHTFTTPPTAGSTPNTRIWVLGDAGTGSSSQIQVRDAFYTWTGARDPNLVLELGDNAYTSGLDSEFQAKVFDIYGSLMKRVPFWSCLGNHETNQATSFVDTYPYFSIYSFPKTGECGGVASGTEHYYSFDYGNVHFICLDSMTADRSATGAMATWVTNDLASTTATWIVAFFHHPPYTKGSHNSDTETPLIQMRTNFLPILEAGGVDLVLSGHSHCYERSYLLDGHYGLSSTLTSAMKKNGGDGRPAGNGAYIKPLTGPRDHFGAVYAVAGSSGQATGGSLNHPAHFISLNNLGSLVLDVSSTRLDATFIRETGASNDTFTIIKQGAADTDHDGISDAYELANGLNRYVNDAASSADSDGISNFLEFAFGLNPNVNDAGPVEANVPGGLLTKRGQPAVWYQATNNGTDFRILFTRRKDYLTDGLIYTPEFSGDLISWVPSPSASSVVIATDGEIELVSIKYPLFAAGKSARFFRVGVSSTH